MQISRIRKLLLFATMLPVFAVAGVRSGIDTSGFNPAVRWQDDLYQAANGEWLRTTSIPDDQSSVSMFNLLHIQNETRCRKLIEQAGKQTNPTANQQKIADLYTSYMNQNRINELGLAPIQAELREIAQITDRHQLNNMIANQESLLVNMPIQLTVSPDPDAPDQNLLQLSQSGLGLPDRDYYLKNDTHFAKARQDYRLFLEKLFSLIGRKQAAQEAEEVITLETRLAELQWDVVSNRDPHKILNRFSLQQLATAVPSIDWPTWFANSGISPPSQINLMQPDYVKGFSSLLDSMPLSSWQHYLRARVLDKYAPFLDQRFVTAYFDFHQRALAGIQQPKERWKTGVALVNDGMGEALGALYVQQYFPPSAKQHMSLLVQNLLKVFAQNIKTLPWMSPTTRLAAQAKLAGYRIKIGYPDRWRDYTALRIQPNDLIGNAKRLSAFNYQIMVAKLDQPVDREEWQMTPQTVNAYYDPQVNEIVFPAGILQPPFFDTQADDAANYGAIGAVIGHEISHGFDDQGSQYDGNGKLTDWWTAEDKQQFNALTARLVDQYQAYEPLPGRHVNGKLTLGENIADNSGLSVAFKAYQLSLAGQAAPILDGLTGDQRFFIAFAQSWRSKMRDDNLVMLLTTDPHTPANFRPRGAIVNSDAFHQAFNVKPGDQLFKAAEDRIRIW